MSFKKVFTNSQFRWFPCSNIIFIRQIDRFHHKAGLSYMICQPICTFHII